ncbi:MAG TPA: glycogen synthase GlgA [Nitrospiria bacterium]|nr:glycogen synthase GlgA [Nitrospiria bacterium]
MRILYMTSEAFPFAKTGGLGDVSGSLPAALGHLGHDVKIVMPKYGTIAKALWGLERFKSFALDFCGKENYLTVWKSLLPESSVEIFFIESALLSNRPGIYGEEGKDYPDNLERFSLFSRAALEIPDLLNWHPDILHANDWQTSLAFLYLQSILQDKPLFKKIAKVLTIHNLAHQGIFPGSEFSKTGLSRDFFTPSALEFYGQINLLKGGLVSADIITTVSPTYGREILTPEYGFGLEGVLHARRKDLHGIINGVDYKKWDPATDPNIPAMYSPENMEGKLACKSALQRRCKFKETDLPVVGIVSRLVYQKGVDLVLEIMEELMALDLQLVVLGTGNSDYEQKLSSEGRKFKNKLSVHVTFNEIFAHRVEAGADIFLMPSRFEPCGLNQLYSLRYGTVPVVRKTGGLADTVVDATPLNIKSGVATGFVFENADADSLLKTLQLALCFYKEKGVWRNLMRAGMYSDFSWERSASEYVKLYEEAAGRIKPGRY